MSTAAADNRWTTPEDIETDVDPTEPDAEETQR
jgi:hypothetical protein